jgi:hypothetical protein
MATADDGGATRLGRWLAPILGARPLTAGRVGAAFAIAVVVDAVQILLGPAGFWVADEVLDLLAMGATVWLLGFDLLLLPTFLIELLPVSDVLPTWTGCVGLVVARRRRRARPAVVEIRR